MMVVVIINYLELLIIQNFNLSRIPHSSVNLNTLPSAQCSFTLAYNTFWLGQLWPFCPKLCVCMSACLRVCVSACLASVPSCQVLEINCALLSLVRPAKRGTCALQKSIERRSSLQIWFTVFSPLCMLWTTSCSSPHIFNNNFFFPVHSLALWCWVVRNPMFVHRNCNFAVFLLRVGKQYLWNTSFYYFRTLVKPPEEVVCCP